MTNHPEIRKSVSLTVLWDNWKAYLIPWSPLQNLTEASLCEILSLLSLLPRPVLFPPLSPVGLSQPVIYTVHEQILLVLPQRKAKPHTLLPPIALTGPGMATYPG